MTNAEKYLKDETKIGEFISDFDLYCQIKDYKSDLSSLYLFLNEQVKPILILTEDERTILRNIDKDNFKAIGRKDDYLYLRYTDYSYEYGETDIKTLTFWYMFHNLFKFIKNGEEYLIEELLENDRKNIR